MSYRDEVAILRLRIGFRVDSRLLMAINPKIGEEFKCKNWI
jgi:hypothetical protein